jgi:hypothetical protein
MNQTQTEMHTHLTEFVGLVKHFEGGSPSDVAV